MPRALNKSRMNGGRPQVDDADECLSKDELFIVLSALWVRRSQLDGVGSASAKARRSVDVIAQKLGGDPEAYFFGLRSNHQHF
jgi:hypothetical protein